MNGINKSKPQQKITAGSLSLHWLQAREQASQQAGRALYSKLACPSSLQPTSCAALQEKQPSAPTVQEMFSVMIINCTLVASSFFKIFSYLAYPLPASFQSPHLTSAIEIQNFFKMNMYQKFGASMAKNELLLLQHISGDQNEFIFKRNQVCNWPNGSRF